MADRPLTQHYNDIPFGPITPKTPPRTYNCPLSHLNNKEWGQRPTYTPEQEVEYRHGFKCLMLSTSLETYHALLRGEAVPLELLDPKWIERYGLRKRTA